MSLLMTLTTAVTGANVLLSLGLAMQYGRILSRSRNSFTGGLLVFAALFLVQNIVYFYYLVTMMPYFVSAVEGYVLTFAVLQLLAFSVLNWVTWK